jgi:uncharacterized protein (UPF0303 family)
MSKLTDAEKQALLEKVQAVEAQEAELVFPSFDSTTAWELGHLFIPEAEKRGYHLALRISMGEQILFQFSMNGTKAGQELWLDRKMRTVYEFGESTERVGLYHEYMGRDFYETPWIDPFTTTKHGGGFPIRLTNSSAVIGALALSGAHGEEHGFIVEMLRKYLSEK